MLAGWLSLASGQWPLAGAGWLAGWLADAPRVLNAFDRHAWETSLTDMREQQVMSIKLPCNISSYHAYGRLHSLGLRTPRVAWAFGKFVTGPIDNDRNRV